MKDKGISIGEYLLCTLMAVGISINVFAGYEMTDPWHNNLLVVAAATAVMMIFLFLTGMSFVGGWGDLTKSGRWIAFGVTAVLFIGEVVALQLAGAFSGPETIDTNPILFWIIVVTVSILVFWTTRARVGIIILFLAFSYMSVAFDFLLYPVSMAGYGAALLAMAVMYAYRGQGGGQREEEGRRRFAHFIRATAIALVAALVASGAYFGIIAPLVDAEKDMRLAEKLMTLEILREAGISSETIIVQEPEEPEIPRSEPEEEREELTGGTAGEKGSLVQVMAIIYRQHVTLFWLIMTSPLLLLALAVGIKLLLRQRWYRVQLRKSNEEGVAALYISLLRKLKKAGFKRPKRQTLLDFARESQEKLEGFISYDATFLRLTQVYLKMTYGYQRISEEELELFEDFYKPFYKNLRKEMGTLKYCLYFFVL